MAANTSRALVSRYLDLYNTGNVVIADEIIAADFVDHTHPELRRGPEDVKHMVTGFRAAFPDALRMVEQVISEGIWLPFASSYVEPTKERLDTLPLRASRWHGREWISCVSPMASLRSCGAIRTR